MERKNTEKEVTELILSSSWEYPKVCVNLQIDVR